MKKLAEQAKAIATLTSILSMVDSWIAFAQVSPASEKSYRKGIRRLAEYCAANSITTPSRADMIAYKNFLQGKYATATANLYCLTLKALSRLIRPCISKD